MGKATNSATGAVVSGDEATLRRLGYPWEVEAEKPKTTRKASTKKSDDK